MATALRDFILVELYTDGTDQVSKRNQTMEEAQFSTVALPFYAVVNSDETVLATQAGLVRSTAAFLTFLRSASAGS